MENLFYSPEDGDEIMFIPNIFMIEKSHIIKDLSNQISIIYDQLYFKDKTADKSRWEYFIHHPSYHDMLFGKIKDTYWKNKGNNIPNDFNINRQYMSIIQFNGQLRLFKYGNTINDIIKKEHAESRQVVGLQAKRLIIRKKMNQGFPDYSGTKFSKDPCDIMFKNHNEYFDEVNRIGLKHYMETFFNANFMHNKMNTLYKYLKMHELKGVYENPEFKYIFIKEDRSKKIQEIFRDEIS